MAFADSTMNRTTGGVLLPPEVSSEIWAKTLENSAIMQLARRISLPGAGMEFQTITGEPTAEWVGEMDEKAVSKHTLGSKKMKGYTMAVILPFSNQFRRDKAALYQEMIDRAPYALGAKLDRSAFGIDDTPGELFDSLANVTAVDIETDTWGGLVTADAAIAANDYITNGWAIAPKAKSMLLTAKDGMDRPLFINSMTSDNSVPALLGHPVRVKKGVYKAGTPDQLGFAGDWDQALYGVVEDIKVDISDQATLNIDGEQVNLWQRNMFAVRFEFEVGFRLKDEGAFVKLVGKTE